MSRLIDKYTIYQDKKIIDLLNEFPEIFYTDYIKKEDLKRLKQFLFDNEFNNIVLYHGTSAKLPILDEGLKPTTLNRRNSLQSTSGFVYLSIFKGIAEQYAKIAYPQQQIKVYKVIVPIEDLKPDKDNLFNARMYKGIDATETLLNSLVYAHGACIKGKIEPYKIKDCT